MGILACAVTGQEPSQFKFKYKENFTLCKKIKRVMADQFKLLYEKGIRRYFVGGGIGVDMWAGELLLEMKTKPEYKDLELIVVLPFPNHDIQWDVRSKKRLAHLLQNCNHSLVIGEMPAAENYKRRNYYMVNHADCLLAVYDKNRSARAAVVPMVNYARKQGLMLIFIHPDTAKLLIEENKRDLYNSISHNI